MCFPLKKNSINKNWWFNPRSIVINCITNLNHGKKHDNTNYFNLLTRKAAGVELPSGFKKQSLGTWVKPKQTKSVGLTWFTSTILGLTSQQCGFNQKNVDLTWCTRCRIKAALAILQLVGSIPSPVASSLRPTLPDCVRVQPTWNNRVRSISGDVAPGWLLRQVGCCARLALRSEVGLALNFWNQGKKNSRLSSSPRLFWKRQQKGENYSTIMGMIEIFAASITINMGQGNNFRMQLRGLTRWNDGERLKYLCFFECFITSFFTSYVPNLEWPWD